MALKYYKWNPCQLIKRTSSSNYTVLDSGPLTVMSAAYEDPTWIDGFNNANLGKWGVIDGYYDWEINDSGKALLTILGKKTTLFRIHMYNNNTYLPDLSPLFSRLRNYITLVDEWSKGQGSNYDFYPGMLYNNAWGQMARLVDSSTGFQITFPIYRNNGTLYSAVYLSINGVSPNQYVSCTVGSYLLSSALSASQLDPIDPSDPYNGIGDSEPGGGETNPGGLTGDTIPEPSLPTISALGTGLVRLYNPTSAQLASFGQWLWGSGLDLDTLKRIFSDPMDMIIGLNIFPVTIPSSTSENIRLGNLESSVGAPVASAQYTTFDMGSINVPYVYNSYLDFAPYTKVQIFLPFIGMKTLNTDEVMSKPGATKSIHVKYSIDLLSGSCVAHILVNNSLMYEFGGTCASQVPLTGRDMTSILSSIAGTVGVISAGVIGAAAMPAAMAASGPVQAAMLGSAGAGIARQVIASKPTVEHASGIGGTTGFLSSQKAYLIIERPRLCHPQNQQHYTGYPGFLYGVVSQLEGFTKFVSIELNNVLAEEEELEELEDWLVNRGVRL